MYLLYMGRSDPCCPDQNKAYKNKNSSPREADEKNEMLLYVEEISRTQNRCKGLFKKKDQFSKH